MFWSLIAATAAAIGLIKLGSLMVIASVLMLTVKALLALIALGIVGIVGFVLWKKHGKQMEI
jgi:hypothetical protein